MLRYLYAIFILQSVLFLLSCGNISSDSHDNYITRSSSNTNNGIAAPSQLDPDSKNNKVPASSTVADFSAFGRVGIIPREGIMITVVPVTVQLSDELQMNSSLAAESKVNSTNPPASPQEPLVPAGYPSQESNSKKKRSTSLTNQNTTTASLDSHSRTQNAKSSFLEPIVSLLYGQLTPTNGVLPSFLTPPNILAGPARPISNLLGLLGFDNPLGFDSSVAPQMVNQGITITQTQVSLINLPFLGRNSRAPIFYNGEGIGTNLRNIFIKNVEPNSAESK